MLNQGVGSHTSHAEVHHRVRRFIKHKPGRVSLGPDRPCRATYQKYLPCVPAEITFFPANAAATSGPEVPTLPKTLASSIALAVLIVFPTR